MSQPKNASPCKLHDRVQRDEFHEREQRQRQTEIRVRELRGVTGEGCGGRPGGAAHARGHARARRRRRRARGRVPVLCVKNKIQYYRNYTRGLILG